MEVIPKLTNFVSRQKWSLGVVVFFGALAFVLFYKFFIFGLIPAPADILIGHYHPLKDVVWEGRTAGYPIKNFLLFDGIRQTLPWRLLAIDQIKSGKLPFWNSLNLGGTPLLANFQAAVFYPFNFLFFIFEKYQAWGWYLYLQPVLAGFFSFLFLQSLNLSFLSSIFGGVCFGFSGMMLNHLEFGIDGHSALWLPLHLYGVNLLFSNKGKKGFFVLTTSLFFNLLAGYPPPVFYNLAAVGLWVVFKVISEKKSTNFRFIVLAMTLAVLLTTPQTLPFLELSSKVERRPEFFGEISGETHFFPFENLLMTIAPDFFGHPSTGNFFSKINYTDSPYIGFWGLVFAILGILAIKRKEAFYGLIVLVSTLVLMLPTGPAMALRKISVPFLSSVSPMRMLWLTGFSLSLLAAVGFDKFKENVFKFKGLKVIGIGLLLIILCWYYSGVIPVGSQQIIARRNLFVPTVIYGLGATVIFLISIFMKKSTKVLRFGRGMMILILATELIRQGFKYNPFIEKSLIYPKTEILSFLSSRPMTEKVLITHQELLPANANIPYRYSMIDGYYSLYDGRAGQMASLANSGADIKAIGGFPRIVYLSNPRGKIIDLLGVSWVMALEKLNDPKLELVMEEGKTFLYRNKQAFPKIFLVKDYKVGKTDLEVAQKVFSVDLKNTVILEEKLDKSDFSKEGVVTLKKYDNGQAVAEINSKFESLIVFNENFYNGWEAYIDGMPTKIFRANYNLQAVVVPPGIHQLNFLFMPKVFLYGVKLMILGVVLLILSCYYFWHLKINDKKRN